MITKLPKEFLEVVQSNNGLSQYLSNLAKGRDMTPRSWLYEDKTPDQILEAWLERLDKLSSGDAFEVKVFQFDTSQLKKWGPQGGIAPIQDLLDDIVLPTFQDTSPTPAAFKSFDWSTAVANAHDVLWSTKAYMLRPASYSNVVADMRARDTLESNSGWPDFSRRNRPEVLNAAIAAAKDGEWVDFPAIALFRNYNQKTRLVWMFPEATNIFEGSYCQPIQSRIIKSFDSDKAQGFFAPWVGFEAVRKLVTNEYTKGKVLAASDFSKTDEHFRLSATYQVLDIMKPCFQKSFQPGLRLSLERMHNIPLIIGPDKMITGKHGVASGSNWTNFIETLFDLEFSFYVREVTEFNTHSLCAIGDDMCWVSDKFDDALAATLAECGKNVGQDLNEEKVTNDQDSVKFLQRLFQRGYNRSDGLCRGVYSTIRALKSAVYPERFHKPELWSSDMFCARTYMILENCVDHPLFEEFVKFVVAGQRDLIPFARKSRGELNEITWKTSFLPGFNPTYNQEKRDSSLADFAAMRIAAEL